MTRQEAINAFKEWIEHDKKIEYADRLENIEIYKLAIKALEQQPCEDAISRQAVLDGLASIAKAKAKSDAQKSLMGRVMFFTEQLPSVEPERNTGKWIVKIEDWNRWTCSECGFSKRTDIHVSLGYKFCPDCGAKMEVKKNEKSNNILD